MKKRTLKLAVYSLMMTAMLFNCKDKDKDPDAPSTEKLDDIKKITVATATYSDPAAVTTTAGSVAASAQATAVASDLDNVTAGNVPASLTTASSAVSAGLSASEVSALSGLSSSTIDAVQKGGAVPADLQAILDKAASNPALAQYLPKITYPTVNGTSVKGARIATPVSVDQSARISGVDAVEKVEVSDACIAAAQAVVDAKKPELDKAKADQLTALNTKYQGWLAAATTDPTTCLAAASQTANKAAAVAAYTAALDKLESAKAALGDGTYQLLKALSGLSLMSSISAYNAIETADIQACTVAGTAKKTAADKAKADATTAINAAYDSAMTALTAAKSAAVATCHNQGSGN